MHRKISGPRLLVSAAAGAALVVSGLAPVAATTPLPTAPDGDAGELTQSRYTDPGVMSAEQWAGVESETGSWIVRLAGAPAATYGALAQENGMEADLESYRADLVGEQEAVLATAADTLGRSLEPTFTYQNALNGFAVEATKAEAERIRHLPGVAEVYPDEIRELETDVSYEVIKNDSVWAGETGTGTGTMGEGVLVGAIDSGINAFHPSFLEDGDMDGYVYENPFGEGNYVGVCDADTAGAAYEDICNDKVVGAYNLNTSSPSALDEQGHGSHVLSTIAGNRHEADVVIGNDEFQRVVQGVAPRANIISYLVCYPGCPTASSVAAVDHAIEDGVDILNYSISGSDTPWTDAVDLAFLSAFDAGITVVASAGNSGPGPQTVAKSGPWNASVAATTHRRAFGNELSLLGDDVPEEAASFPGFPGDGPAVTEDIVAPVVDGRDVGDVSGCTAFPEGTFEGSIALLERGGCTFEEKTQIAEDAGALAVVLGNNAGGPPSAPGGLAGTPVTIPTLMTDLLSYEAVKDYLDSTDEPVEMRISAGTEMYSNDEWTDVVASFSSRGPSQYDMQVPTYAAPGVNILAAGAIVGEDYGRYEIMGGTSMASPHGAGASALLRALQPEWTPTEIRSALATSAVREGLVKEDGVTAADPFDIGSGRIDVERASRVGLVLDEDGDAFRAANPADGGEPRDLNLPAFVDWNCEVDCTVTREVTSVLPGSATYTASVEAPEGMSVTVEPASFTIAEGETVELTITADVSGAALDEWVHGYLTLSTDATHANGLAVTDPTFPISLTPREGTPSIEVEPEEITSTQPVDTTEEHNLTIGNTGKGTLNWEIADATSAPLIDQPVGGTSGIVSDFFPEPGSGTYSAEDFTVTADGTTITGISAPGFMSSGLSLPTWVNEVVWEIYADADGEPGGHPEDGSDPVWRYAAAPEAEGVDAWEGDLNLDLAAAGQELELDAGTYWMVAYADMDNFGVNSIRWNWSQGGDAQGAPAMLNDVSGLFGGTDGWTEIGPLVEWDTLALTIDQQVACGADWLTVDPTSGSVEPGGSADLTVTTDSTGMEVGEYTATICIEHDDESTGTVLVPVTMEVTEAAAEPIEVERVAGSNRYETAAQISERFAAGQDVVFVATGGDYPDALAGSALAGALDAPVLLTHQGHLTQVTRAELERLDADSVIVLGGPTAVSDRTMDQIEAVNGADVVRLSGDNRFATAAEIAGEFAESFGEVDRVFVATGRDYPDALAASARAGALNAPVLLVAQDRLPKVTADALAELDADRITVLGADAAVSDEVFSALESYGEVNRIAGPDRYGTATRLMQDYVGEGVDTVFLASGQDWPDALAGAAWAGSDEKPLVLTRSSALTRVTGAYLKQVDPERVVILGGPSAVSEDVADDIRALRGQ